jgi:hypothetical protein
MKKIIALVLAVGVIVGTMALAVKFEDKIFTEHSEDIYLEINDEVIYDYR